MDIIQLDKPSLNEKQIYGLKVIPLRKIEDERGAVLHMLRQDSPHFSQFGEVYFSKVNYGYVKAWKKHLNMTQHFAVPHGKIKLVCYDNRENSISKGLLKEVILGEEHYSLVIIPPEIWYGFQGLSSEYSLITNCTNYPYDSNEVERVSENDSSIPYFW